MIGKSFIHKHNPNFTCVVVDVTNKGYKTLFTETKGKKTKTTTQYYHKIDFDENKGLWNSVN